MLTMYRIGTYTSFLLCFRVFCGASLARDAGGREHMMPQPDLLAVIEELSYYACKKSLLYLLLLFWNSCLYNTEIWDPSIALFLAAVNIYRPM